MIRASILALALAFATAIPAAAQSQSTATLRVAMAGLAHGHADGFLNHIKDRHDVELVGIAEPDKSIFDRYAAKFNLDPKLYHADLDELLTATKPQAVLVYTNTHDHVHAVEICAKHKIPVMMEKPLAISIADAHAIERAAKAAITTNRNARIIVVS